MFPHEWLRGLTSFAVMGVLQDTPMHGYAIIRALEQAGLGTVKGGTLYPILARMEAAGHIVATWEHSESGPGRKVFALTPAGQQHLDELKPQWQAFAASMKGVMGVDER